MAPVAKNHNASAGLKAADLDALSALTEKVKGLGVEDIVVICGGVIPPQDYDEMLAMGVSAVYGPGTNILLAAHEVLGIIRDRRQASQEK